MPAWLNKHLTLNKRHSRILMKRRRKTRQRRKWITGMMMGWLVEI